jgi:hypothetical protein
VFSGHWAGTMGFLIENFRKVYGELDKGIREGVKREKGYRRNSGLLEQVVKDICSDVGWETEKGVLGARKVKGLGEGVRESIRDFGERVSVMRDRQAEGNGGKKNGWEMRQQQKQKIKEFGGIGVIDFDSEPFEENEMLRAEAQDRKDKEVKERVDELIFLMDDPEFLAKFDGLNEDPFVLIALNRRVNEEMGRDQASNLFNLTNFLKNNNSLSLVGETRDQTTAAMKKVELH